MEIVTTLRTRKISERFVMLFHRARHGFPGRIFVGAGGIGDDLLCSAVFRELRKRGGRRPGMLTRYPGLFHGNPDVNIFVPEPGRSPQHDLPVERLGYTKYDAATDIHAPLDEHIIAKICRVAGITGTIALRPYFFPTRAELAAGRIFPRQVVIQSSATGSPHGIANKEWFPERFQSVCDRLAPHATVVQLGAATDPLMRGAHDLRGKTNLRESAAILANSLVYVGLEGFLMHLARAVDCRSAIVYGGRLSPWQIGYSANIHLAGATPCSPCWQKSRCAHDRECMEMIPADALYEAALEQIGKHGAPLEIETAEVSAEKSGNQDRNILLHSPEG